MRAKVVAGVAPADGSDPGGVWDQGVRVGLTVEDEEKVGLGVQPVGDEELQVTPRLLGLTVYVCDERTVGLGSGWCVLGDGFGGVMGGI